MNRLIFLFTVLFGLAACNNCDCSGDTVCVTIMNATGQPIETVSLRTQSLTMVSTGQLAVDDKTCLSFKGPGEGAFNLMAILSDGDTLKSIEEYSEGGYKFAATITKDTIKMEFKNNY